MDAWLLWHKHLNIANCKGFQILFLSKYKEEYVQKDLDIEREVYLAQAAAFNSESVQHASAASLIKASVGVVVGLGASSSIRIRRLCRQACLVTLTT
jgi:hypothetical protein